MDEFEPKQLVWVGSTRRDLREFPPAVRRIFGVALFAAQLGETPADAKPLRALGVPACWIEDHRGGSYRAVYTVRFATEIYVLHAVSEKFEAWYRDTQARYRGHSRAPEIGRTTVQGKMKEG